MKKTKAFVVLYGLICASTHTYTGDIVVWKPKGMMMITRTNSCPRMMVKVDTIPPKKILSKEE